MLLFSHRPSEEGSVSKKVRGYCSISVALGVLTALALLISLYAIVALHSLTIWISTDPEKAFHRARQLVGFYSTGWNSVREVYNGARYVAFAWVPAYNTWVKHTVEPGVNIALDIISLIFAKKHYEGVISEDQVPFLGHYCGDPSTTALPDRQTSKWCSFQSIDAWAEELNTVESSNGKNAIYNETTLLLSATQVRRLAEFVLGPDDEAEGASLFPTLHLKPLVDAVGQIAGSITLLTSTVADITVHVIYLILSNIAVLIWNAFQFVMKALLGTILSLTQSGALQSILSTGIDLLMVLVVYVGIPLLIVTLDVFICLINMLSPGTWPEQVACVERVCFREDGQIGSELFSTFSSIPVISNAINEAIQALINPQTGRKFTSSGISSSTSAPDYNFGRETPTSAAETCAQCFTCKVPEIRLLWLLVASTYGCIKDERAYGGKVEDVCLDNGQYYLDACGPREASFLKTSQWQEIYTEHRNFDTGRVNHYSGLFEQLARDMGGGTSNGYLAQYISDQWNNRDVNDPQNIAAGFYRAVCDLMRDQFPGVDVGPGHVNKSEGSMGYLSGAFLYESCKSQRFDLCTNNVAVSAIDTWYEISNCMFDMPTCRRDREVCLGRCGGNSTGMEQDFMTLATKQELSQRTLGAERLSKGLANCTIRNRIVEVPLFDGMDTDAFRLFASRTRVRGGALAIDPRACALYPKSCAAVIRAIEKDPTLTFVNGRFVPSRLVTVPSPPPPSPSPPLLDVYQRKQPPPPPSPAPSPPPWFLTSETCIPVVTAEEAEVVVEDGKERSLCLYVRSIQDERVRANRCFGEQPPSPPPPPPVPHSREAAVATALLRRRVRKGGSNGPVQGEQEVSSIDQYKQEHDDAVKEQLELLDRLANDNFQLRGLLNGVRDRVIQTASSSSSEGRRLWERDSEHKSYHLQDNLMQIPAIGNRPITGISIAQCQAICRGLLNETTGEICKGIAFARSDPSNPRDQSVRQCFLLSQTGGCSAATFASQIYLRRDTESCDAPTVSDNPLCVQLSPLRTDLRVLDFYSARSACQHGKGRPGIANPQTPLEAFTMIAQARERGVHAFWAAGQVGGGTLPWTGMDGNPLVVEQGDRRCVLVSTISTDIYGHMYAEMKPCAVRLADGVVCESSSLYPPSAPRSPPGSATTAHVPPSPPPRPIGVVAAFQAYTKREIVPRTEAVCIAGMDDEDVSKMCIEFANFLAMPTREGIVASFTPLCTDLCFHSCGAKSDQDRDGFENCRDPSCADTQCIDFFLTECPSSTHAAVRRVFEAHCGLGYPLPPPSPPLPASVPVSPPLTSPPPPLASSYGRLRLGSSETDQHADCLPVTYRACRDAAIEVGNAFGLSTQIRINLAACESAQSSELASCFIGCSLGDQGGAPATYTFLSPRKLVEFGEYNSYRCATAPHEYCLCADPSPNPPPPPALSDETTYLFSGIPEVVSSYSGHAGAYYKRVARDAAMQSGFRDHFKRYDCVGDDSGAVQCATHCSRELGPDLFAFSVTGRQAPPPPPNPDPPPWPPSPPPAPLPPRGSRFNGGTDSCAKANIYEGNECRDGGLGSVYPPACDYGTQIAQCGPREFIDQNAAFGDDSCIRSKNDLCEDGGPGSEGNTYLDENGREVSHCGYGTDQTDCPVRFMTTLGSLSFAAAPQPPTPHPPPGAPARPPPAPSPHKFVSCSNTCESLVVFCSDGGLGARTNVQGVFECDFGTHCDRCGPRLDVDVFGTDSSPTARNGICEDVASGGQEGYGTDTADCGGYRRVVRDRGAPLAETVSVQRRLSELESFGYSSPDPPSPPPPPPSPPPPPFPPPPLEMNNCECWCTSNSDVMQNDSEGEDVSDISLISSSIPSANTNLYSSYASVHRGAPQIAKSFLFFDNNIDSAVLSDHLSRPVAHLIDDWKLPIGDHMTKSGYITVAMNVSFDEMDYKKLQCRYESLQNGKSSCYSHFNIGIADGCASLYQSDRQLCPVCCNQQELSYEHENPFLKHRVNDEANMTSKDVDMSICLMRCQMTSQNVYKLHMVEVGSNPPSCVCLFTGSAESVRDDTMMEILRDGYRDDQRNVSIYAVGPPIRQHLTLPRLGGTVYYEQAFPTHTDISGHGNPYYNSITSLEACIELCIEKNNKYEVHTVEYDTSLKYCTCLDIDVMDPIMEQYTDVSNPVLNVVDVYTIEWCDSVVPDEDDGAYVHIKDRDQWCPGKIGSHMGRAVQRADVVSIEDRNIASTCAQNCDDDDACNAMEVLTVPWSDLVGPAVVRPPPPPLPPSDPRPDAPLYPPLPPNNPLFDRSDEDLYRQWYPMGNDAPRKNEVDSTYEVTCAAPSSCSGGHLPIFKGTHLEAVELARDLDQTNAFYGSLCPWECTPTLTEHEVNAIDQRSLLSWRWLPWDQTPRKRVGFQWLLTVRLVVFEQRDPLSNPCSQGCFPTGLQECHAWLIAREALWHCG